MWNSIPIKYETGSLKYYVKFLHWFHVTVVVNGNTCSFLEDWLICILLLESLTEIWSHTISWYLGLSSIITNLLQKLYPKLFPRTFLAGWSAWPSGQDLWLWKCKSFGMPMLVFLSFLPWILSFNCIHISSHFLFTEW